jgi:cell wall-associated NlpC family hydrolase
VGGRDSDPYSGSPEPRGSAWVMSIEAVVGRVQQILAMEQQLSGSVAAAAAAPSSAAVASTAGQPSAATGTSSTASFSDALASAQGSTTTQAGGLSSTATAPGTASSPATSSSDPRVQAMITMANSLLGKPYVWGGLTGIVQGLNAYGCHDPLIALRSQRQMSVTYTYETDAWE